MMVVEWTAGTPMVRALRLRPTTVGSSAPQPDTHLVWVRPDANRRFRLRHPMLKLHVEGGEVAIVSDSFSTVYGTGDDLDAAIADYLRTLFDYFAKLEQRDGRLGPALEQELAVLRRHIVPIQ
jgi:hypothetical protein